MRTRPNRPRRGVALLCVLAMAAATLLIAPPQSSANPSADPADFSQGPGGYNAEVPDGTCTQKVTLQGGGGGAPAAAAMTGGAGAILEASYHVAPGIINSGTVGAGGRSDSTAGANGGGAGGGDIRNGGGGGGWSSFEMSGTELWVAGGGGGAGWSYRGGAGGGGNAGTAGVGVDGVAGADPDILPGLASGAGGPNNDHPSFSGLSSAGRVGGAGGPVDGPYNNGGGGGGGGVTAGGGGASIRSNGSGAAGGAGGASSQLTTGVDPGGIGAIALAASLGPNATRSRSGEDGKVEIDYIPCNYELGVTKSASPTSAVAGQTVTFTIVVTNNGPDHMTRGDTVTIVDDVASQFTNAPTNVAAVHSPGAAHWLDQGAVTCTGPLTAYVCSQPYGAAAFTGSPSGGVRGLDVGGTITVTYDVVIDAADVTSPPSAITNTVEVTDRAGTKSATASVEPAIEEAHLLVEKSTISATNNGDGTYAVAYEISVENPTSVPGCLNDGSDACYLSPNTNVQLTDDLGVTFGPSSVSAATSTVSSGPCSANGGYSGVAPAAGLLSGADSLAVGDKCVIAVAATITVDPDTAGFALLGTHTNTVTATSTEIAADVSATSDATFEEAPAMTVAKAVTAGPTNNTDGTYTLDYTIDVVNTGDVELQTVQVVDAMGDPAVFGTALSSVSLAVTGPCDANPGYNGVTPATGLLDGNDVIPVGGSCQIVITAVVTVDDDVVGAAALDTPYTNTAAGTAEGPGGTDVNATGQAEVEFSAAPMIGATKSVTSGPTGNGDGTYSMAFEVVVTNTGNVELDSVQATDNLSALFGAGLTSAVATVASGPCDVDPGYDGSAVTTLLDGNDVLAISESCLISIAVTVDSAMGAPVNTVLTNEVDVEGESPSGEVVYADAQADVELVESPGIGLTKSVTAGPTSNRNGTYSLTYQLDVANTGDIALDGVQVSDDLATLFAGGLVSATASTLSGPCTVDTAYNGGAPATILTGADLLAVGGTCSLSIAAVVTVDDDAPSQAALNTAYVNNAAAQGDSPSDVNVTASATQTVEFTEAPGIDVTKAVAAGPTSNGDGTYDLVYEMTVSNTGDVDLDSVQVTDDLSIPFGAGLTSAVPTVTAGTCTANPAYDGSGVTTTLTGADILAFGQSCTISLAVSVDSATGAPVNTALTNTVDADGESPAGAANTAQATVDVVLPENPAIELTKSSPIGPVNNRNGTYTVTYIFDLVNTGDVLVDGVQITDDLDSLFGTALVSATPTVVSGPCTADSAYTGVPPAIGLLTGADVIMAGVGCQIELVAVVTVDEFAAGAADLDTDYTNTADATASSPSDFAVDASDTETVQFTEKPSVGIDKQVTATPVNNTDGTYTLGYSIEVVNTGNVELRDVQVVDDLEAVFGPGAATVDAISATTPCQTDPAYDGSTANSAMLDGNDLIPFGGSCVINMTVTVDSTASTVSLDTNYDNVATVTASAPTGEDVEESASAPAMFSERPAMSVTKNLSGPAVNNQDGTFTATFDVVVGNEGDVNLNNVQVTDALQFLFGSDFGSATVSAVAPCVANPAFTGMAGQDVGLLAPGVSLLVGQACKVSVEVVLSGSNLGPYRNLASGSASSPVGTIVNADDVAAVSLEEAPNIEFSKEITSGPTSDGTGTYEIGFTLVATNTGDVPLNGAQITDNLGASFSEAGSWSVASLTSADCTANTAGFVGSDGADMNLLTGADNLAVNDSCTVDLVVTFTPGPTMTSITNVAVATGTSPAGSAMRAEDDATIGVEEGVQQIGLSLDVSAADNGNGTYDVTYTTIVMNAGSGPLQSVQITDPLTTVFEKASSWEVIEVRSVSATDFASFSSAGDSCTINPNFDGDGDVNLLAGIDDLGVGQRCAAEFVVLVKPVAGRDWTFVNSAKAQALSRSGTAVSDVSQDGLSPEPAGSEVTPVTLAGATPLEVRLPVVALPTLEPGFFGDDEPAVEPSGPAPRGLAYTGSEVGNLLTIAAVLLASGTGLLLIGRRRRDDESDELSEQLDWEPLEGDD